MSYCRFRNTLGDLKDCRDFMDDDVSEEEATARKRLIEVCAKIADDYRHEVEN
jgi:hypothetical protein